MATKKVKESKLSTQEQQLLKQANDILAITNTEGFKTVMKFIKNAVVFPDPKDFTNREAIILPYTEAFGMSKLALMVEMFVESQDSVLKSINEKVDDEFDKPDFAIGT